MRQVSVKMGYSEPLDVLQHDHTFRTNSVNFPDILNGSGSLSKDLKTSSFGDAVSNILESIRLLFGSSDSKNRSSFEQYQEETASAKDNTSAKYTSSGYQSLEESLDLEESYIKVSRFAGNNDFNSE